MYIKDNKNGKILNILLGVIALFIIMFIIAWVVNKSNNGAVNETTFKNNLETLHEKAKEHFADDLPKEIGDSTLLSLDEMYDLDLIDELNYGKEECDTESSYSSITKINSSEYKVKTNLVCGSKSDNIAEKIETNTVIDDEDGNVIIDSDKDNVNLEVNEKPSSSNSSNNSSSTGTWGSSYSDSSTVDCLGPVCTFRQIETTCDTTYEYEYVKRNVSCPSGYVYQNGVCVSEQTNTVDAVANYSQAQTIIEDAKFNEGSSYRRYTDPVIKGGDTYYYCNKGTLKGSYCYQYKNQEVDTYKYCPSGYTRKGSYCYKYTDLVVAGKSSCPYGYTAKNNACYKYADLITTGNNSCPSGYTQSGNSCYKYADLITNNNTTYSCPSGYSASGNSCVKTVSAVKKYGEWGNPDRTYSTSSKESTYTNETSKKVLVGSNKVGKTYVYTYAIYSRKSYYSCSQGTLSGSTCYIYANKVANNSSTTSCPYGYTQSGNTCYIKTDLQYNTTSYCPSGYTQSGNTCYIKTNRQYSDTSYCPSGYTRDGNSYVCYKKKKAETITENVCPSGYSKDGRSCVKKTKALKETTNKKYSCPSGYTQQGSGRNMKCYKTYYSKDHYYCENENATLKGKKCYTYVEAKYTGSTCPSGYTQTENGCVQTTTITANPIWSNAETIYSSATYLEGYQRTGVAKFVTTCTPINEIHYK